MRKTTPPILSLGRIVRFREREMLGELPAMVVGVRSTGPASSPLNVVDLVVFGDPENPARFEERVPFNDPESRRTLARSWNWPERKR